MSRQKQKTAPKRSRQVIFRLTEKEYEQLEACARQAGLTANELARSFARTSRGRLTVKATQRLDPAYVAQVKRIGNNLNQLARSANIYGKVSPELEQLCNEIREVVLQAVRKESE